MISLHLRKLPQSPRACKLGLWYVGIEFHRHPPHRWSNGFLFLPYVFAYCVKWEQFGDKYLSATIEATFAEKRRGGFFYGTFPFGFNLTIERR